MTENDLIGGVVLDLVREQVEDARLPHEIRLQVVFQRRPRIEAVLHFGKEKGTEHVENDDVILKISFC